MEEIGFEEKQDKVSFKTEGDTTRVTICLNESQKTVEALDGLLLYIYDVYEWSDKTENLDLDDIKANPENYLDKAPKTIIDNVTDLISSQSDIKDNVSDLVDAVATLLFGG